MKVTGYTSPTGLKPTGSTRSSMKEILVQGDAFPLVEKLLSLNRQLGQPRVEVILVSRNSADTGLRVFNSIQHYGLGISRAAFVGGRSPIPTCPAFGSHLFPFHPCRRCPRALEAGFAAATILSGGPRRAASNELRIAFDGDAVLFSDDSERVYQRGGLKPSRLTSTSCSRSAGRWAVQALSGGPEPVAARISRRAVPDPHGAGHRAFGSRA